LSKPAFRPPPAQLFKTLYALGLGPLVGRVVLLLTTSGRKTGLPRLTPLQYEEVNGDIYLGSSRGVKADWFKNIQANPCVSVQVKGRRFQAMAEPVIDPARIADFLELRLKRHPRMVGAILKSEGLSFKPTRTELEVYAANLAMVILHPDENRPSVSPGP
jgi:deazaflavin-dependent oxidoreductase (nitroreductase family)